MLLLLAPVVASGQPMTPLDVRAEVYTQRVLVRLPKPYLFVKAPNPPLEGYFAWKLVVEGSTAMAVVFRTDSAVRVTDAKDVVRLSRLYACPDITSSVLDCVEPIQGVARSTTSEVIDLDITEPSFVAFIRSTQPRVMLRSTIEPGGRFRVDHIGIRYR